MSVAKSSTHIPSTCCPVLLLCPTQFLDHYVKTAAGPLKWVKLVDFLKSTYPQIINDMMARKEAQVRRLKQQGCGSYHYMQAQRLPGVITLACWRMVCMQV